MQADVVEVLNRALVDDEFLNQMATDPDTALRDFNLTDEERAVLLNPNRDVLELMRVGGVGPKAEGRLGFNIDVTIIIDLTLDLNLDLTLTWPLQTLPAEMEARRSLRRAQIEGLAKNALATKAGAERIEQLQKMLETVSGAERLAAGGRQ